VNLDADDIEAVAARVVALLRDEIGGARRYVDAAMLAKMLGVRRAWVYSRARQLGAVRLGEGPRAPLRFDVERVRAALGEPDPDEHLPREAPSRRRGPRRRQMGAANVPLIRGRSGR
jgi:hypothetical protein